MAVEFSAIITIAIADDRVVDPDETFSVTIDNVTRNGTSNAPRTVRITIKDNEIPFDVELWLTSRIILAASCSYLLLPMANFIESIAVRDKLLTGAMKR